VVTRYQHRDIPCTTCPRIVAVVRNTLTREQLVAVYQCPECRAWKDSRARVPGNTRVQAIERDGVRFCGLCQINRLSRFNRGSICFACEQKLSGTFRSLARAGIVT
jgi:hypothetical protein